MLHEYYQQLLWTVFLLSYVAGMVTGGTVAYLILMKPERKESEPVHLG